MKKFRNLVILGLVVMAFGLTSCKKEYNCICTVDYEDNTYIDDFTTDPFSIGEQTKSDAEKICGDNVVNYQAEGVTVSCEVE